MIPDIIGDHCAYPSLNAYIASSFTQLNNLNTFKEKQILDLKSYKEKLDKLIKTFSSQIENVKKAYSEYCKQALNATEEEFNKKYQRIDERLEQMRLENGKYSIELKQKSESLGIEWEKVINLKEEIKQHFHQELKKFEKRHQNTVCTFEQYKKEFQLIKNRFTQLSEFIKDVRFRRNYYELRKSTNLLARNIDFQKKQKIIEIMIIIIFSKTKENN
jgi:hypothetical protein